MLLRTNMIITKKSDEIMKNQIERADIHCHILPGVDDGAQTLEEAGCLLRLEKENHISMIFLTCHYRGEAVEKFIQDRQNAYDNLIKYVALEKENISLKLGAEVFFYPGLSKKSVENYVWEIQTICCWSYRFIIDLICLRKRYSV